MECRVALVLASADERQDDGRPGFLWPGVMEVFCPVETE
jgi:hypothetical protein